MRSLYGKLKEAAAVVDKEAIGWPLADLEREAPEVVMDVEAAGDEDA